MSSFKLKIRRIAASLVYRTPLLGSFQQKGLPWRILMYHRVVEPEKLPVRIQPGMYVRPATFQRHLEYLRANCNVVPLHQLISALVMKEEIPRGTVCITFDDGWVDNYSSAFPLLCKFEVPATIFLITGYVGTDEIFWVDRLSLALSQSQLKKNADLDLSYLHSLEQVIDANTYAALWEAYASTAREDEVTLLDKLATLLIRVPPAPRAQLLSRLFRVIPARLINCIPRSFVSWGEVDEMARAGITFGSHTHTNQLLTEIDAPQIHSELTASYDTLRAHGLRPSDVFCYPSGLYNSQSQKCLAERGVRFALLPGSSSDFTKAPALISRVAIHEDIASSIPLFATRVWASDLF